MEETEYRRMYDTEDDHWWFRGVRLYMEDVLWERLRGMPLLLDAGCGSGGNLEWLRGLGFQAMGFDLSFTGAQLSRGRNKNVFAADINRLPYADNSFDAVLCCNVFESAEVDEAAALAELSRALRPGGFALLTLSARSVPAGAHDKAVHCVRRYGRDDIRRTFNAAGFRVRKIRGLFGTMLPLFMVYRGARRALSRIGLGSSGSDVFPLPSLIDKLLFAWVGADAFLSQLFPFPFGSTYLVLLEKKP